MFNYLGMPTQLKKFEVRAKDILGLRPDMIVHAYSRDQARKKAEEVYSKEKINWEVRVINVRPLN